MEGGAREPTYYSAVGPIGSGFDSGRLSFVFRKVRWLLLAAVAIGFSCGPPPERSLCSGQRPSGSSIRIAALDEPGEPMVITGQAWVGKQREPLSGARLIVYHMNADGRYAKDESGYAGAYLCGVLETDSSGRYRIETIRPGSDPHRKVAAHVHFELTTPWGDRIHDGLSIHGDPFLGSIAVGESWEEVRPVTIDAQGVHHIQKDFWIRF